MNLFLSPRDMWEWRWLVRQYQCTDVTDVILTTKELLMGGWHRGLSAEYADTNPEYRNHIPYEFPVSVQVHDQHNQPISSCLITIIWRSSANNIAEEIEFDRLKERGRARLEAWGVEIQDLSIDQWRIPYSAILGGGDNVCARKGKRNEPVRRER